MTTRHTNMWTMTTRHSARRLLLFAFFCLLVGCASKPSEKQQVGFTIAQSGDTTHITVLSPWQQGNTMAHYALTAPYQRIACTSATHIGFLRELGLIDRVVGVCQPDRIYNLTDDQRSTIADLGDDMKPNLEAILMAQPDAIIVSTYAKGDATTAQIAALGIPVLYCNEWTESTPLARAEWIRFFGACFGCLQQADSIYHAVESAYRYLADNQPSGNVSIMSGQSFRGTWYVPTGNTFMGQLFRDAGARYCYMDHPSTSSLPLTFEQALQDFSQADVWVGCNAGSLDELATIDPKHTWFRAFKQHHVYNFNRRTLPSGANDFWETGVVHPELILRDLQRILATADENAQMCTDNATPSDLFFSEQLQ